MALPFKHTGTFLRSCGIYAALGKQSKLLNLKPVKKIVFSFDPFSPIETVRPIRNAMSYFYQNRVQLTNTKCVFKTNVLCSRAEPTIDITLETGHKILFKTENLSTLEILQLFNTHISSKVEVEEVADTPKTKIMRKR